jgi:hypothetical protein
MRADNLEIQAATLSGEFNPIATFDDNLAIRLWFMFSGSIGLGYTH